MPFVKPATGRTRYIVRASDPALLVDFLRRIENDADAELVDVIGPADAPHTAVLLLSPEKAAALARDFQNSKGLTIEPDRPLSLFGKA